ncbi:hypothetical protein H7169_00320 [Candidatus Gracilibacteria bacterium]|nr:hypothetical protein [Candidatus Gracilibacteria bacterium]
MENQNTESGVNTVLIVIILLIIVGAGAWWLTMRGGVTPIQQGTPKINVDVKIPKTLDVPTGTGL